MLRRAKIDARESIGYVYWDMWCAYMKAIPKKLPQVLKILDRYHLVVNVGQGVGSGGC